MLPIVCIVGKSNVGKTTLLEGLIAELKLRGRRVATVKHDVHGFEIDQPGKDSWRHAQAGSDAVVISSPQKLALIRHTDHDSSLEEIARLIGDDFDIVLAEGYKNSTLPKIEVHRKALGEGLLCSPDELIAIATDEHLDIPVWQCSLDDIPKLTNFIEQTFLSEPKEEATLFVNDNHIPLSPFVRSFVMETVKGMVSTLKGVDTPKRIDLWIRGKD
ncbi:MAG: molybdopterin-guanine dinucleotide biosynthesis protein B [Chloroflexi bacterium RBG_13_54_9]|nr:MAG: molybdopterin-guanine dinucleotide biosynthesis protein B [Chloroflexi bacterium RBG_13_54_9]